MASTFGILNTAYSGLAAARAALEVTGENVSNASTTGYTRQKVDQVDASSATTSSVSQAAATLSSGVQVTGVSRVTDALVNNQVNSTASTSAYWTAASSTLSTVETSLNEPSDSGLSSVLSSFWSAWGTMASNAGGTDASSSAEALIQAGKTVASTISSGYQTAASGWSSERTDLVNTVQTVNDTAKQVASLNQQIQTTKASGGNTNALEDQRDTAINTLATLTGATTRTNSNGSVDVIVGGNSLVSGSTARSLTVTGATDLTGVSSNAVQISWADGSQSVANVTGGTAAGQLVSLAAANSSGTGGAYAEAAAAYNTVATSVATQVNALQTSGYTSSGTKAGNFFDFSSSTAPAATSLTVTPTSVSGLALYNSSGSTDDSIATSLSQLGTATGSPNTTWSAFVTKIGAQSSAATSQSTVATTAATAATTSQTSVSGVDLDQEVSNLVIYQHAYQGAARVMTAVDSMLDTLINHTGVVGIS